MSKRKYPYIYRRSKLSDKHKPKTPPGQQCSKCLAPATYRCEIQVNWFRGDDEYEYRCDAHSKQEI